MFQFDRIPCPHEWNFQKLRKILRIPENQLKLLNCIPGWSKETSEKSSSFHSNKKVDILEKTSSILENTSSKNNIKERDQIYLQPFSKISKASDLGKTQLKKTNTAKTLLKKSASVDSIYKINPSFDFTSIKRTKSLSSMAKISTLPSSCLSDLESNVFCSKINEQTINRNNDLDDSKSQFIDSAVQCQMSQSSQINLDVPLSQRVDSSKVKSQTGAVKNNVSRPETKFEEWKLIDTVSDSSQKTILRNKSCPNNIESVSHKGELALKNSCMLEEEKYKESYDNVVSQPIPCAQPQSIDKNSFEKQSLARPAEKRHSSVELPNIQNSAAKTAISEEKIKVALGKRKRRNKQDKIPKKMRGMSDINIQYSSGQIKDMLKVLKIIHSKV